MGIEEDVQDAIQDTFCRYMEKKLNFRDEEHEKAWLIRVDTNISRDMIRFRIRHPKVSIDELENSLVALAVGIVSLPVQAIVKNIVKARMESIPQEEVQAINDMVQEQRNAEADGFSREYSDEEEERSSALWQEYKNGTFPEKTITQVDTAEDVTEGMLCYIRSTGVFNLPDREMTDEEILEIIDFQNKMSYAVSQGPAAQEARAEYLAEKDMLREKVQAAGGISEEEAIEIARNRMEAELGEKAEGKEILKYEDGSVAVMIQDISGQTDYEHKGDVAYTVIFSDPNDHSTYYCMIDAVDGSILKTYE